MIIIFGPAGSGKSLQGQILAARNNWRWLSAGQILRDRHDPNIISDMHAGKLVEPGLVNSVMKAALERASDIHRVILDGYPRMLEQAKWLVENQPTHNRSVEAVIVLDIDREIIFERLRIRGRLDDDRATVEKRLDSYEEEINPILEYMKEQNINIIHVDGSGKVGEIHDLIMEELAKCKLV